MITAKPGLAVHIRWHVRQDMPRVLAIEQASSALPWTEEDFLRRLRQRNCIGMVAECDGCRIAGFMFYELHQDCLDLLNLSVHPSYRLQGIGSQLVNSLTVKLSPRRRTRLNALLPESNLPGQLFLRSQGFIADCVHRSYYSNGDDAYDFHYTAKE